MAVSRKITSASRSYKVVAAELDGCVVCMPIAKTGTRRCTVWNDSGIPVPSAWSGAGVSNASTGLTGTFLVAISYRDSVRGRRGAPTGTKQISITNKAIRVAFGSLSNTTANTEVDEIEIWRTLDAGNILFRIGATSIAASTYLTAASDATISGNDPLLVDRQAQYAVPADTWAFVRRHGKRMFYGGDPLFYGATSILSTTGTVFSEYANRMGWSDLGNPDAIPTDNQVEVGGQDPIRCYDGLGDMLVVYKEREIHLWTYREGPNGGPDGQTGAGSIDDMKLGRGALTWKSVVNVDGVHFCMDRSGWYVYRGGQSLLDITEQIRPILDRVNWNYQHLICGTFDDHRIIWFLPLDGDTECKHAVMLDRKAFETGRGVVWWPYRLPQGIRDCTSFVMGRETNAASMGMAGRRLCLVQTTAGFEYVMDTVLRDGVHPNLTARGYTTATASLTFTAVTTTGGTADFDVATGIGTADLAGAFVKFDHPRTPDPVRIAGSASNQFTLASALGFTLPVSTAFTVGGIDAFWKSGQLSAGDPHNLKQAFDFDLVFEPTGVNCELNMRPFGDRLGARVAAASTQQTGWRFATNDDHVTLDMGGRYASNGRTGFVSVPLQTRDFGHVQIELFSNTVDCPWKISSFSMAHRTRNTDR